MSLQSGDNFKNSKSMLKDGFLKLFMSDTGLTDASNLIIPATELNTGCYENMFNGCISLTTAPALPATVLATRCYWSMFSNCVSLNYIKCLATNISAYACLSNWVSGVSATGTFVKAASMTGWSTGDSGTPSGWTVQNAQ